ncbi:MAG: alpha/beta fold hydrolase [Saprospiraceae bacterium]|nr:alpha/beta fold hydrolase [Saprospiraceae bacterium]
MKLNFKTFGQGPPLIILHGLFGMLDNWQTAAKQLSDTFMVFILDQRNHGRSPHVDGIDYPSMANDLKIFMEENWIHEAHLIGHSMGGKTVMQFALEYPEMTDKLIVVDIAPKAYSGGHQLIFEALQSLELDKVQSRAEADQKLGQLVTEIGTRQFLLKNLSRDKDSGGFRWKMNLPVIARDYPKIIAGLETDDQFEGETLFLKGGKSDYIMPSDEEDIMRFFPSSQVQTIEGAGHWIHAEQPKALLQAVRQFLEN